MNLDEQKNCVPVIVDDVVDVRTQEEIIIDLVNKESNASFNQAVLLKGNTLRQLLDGYAEDIGIDKNKPVIFVNKRTGRSCSDLNATIEEMELQTGDVLSVADYGSVAGDSFI